MNRSVKWVVAGTALAVAGGVLAAAPAQAAPNYPYTCVVNDVNVINWSNATMHTHRYSDGTYSAKLSGSATVRYEVKCDGYVKKSKWNKKKKRYVTKKRAKYNYFGANRVESVYGTSIFGPDVYSAEAAKAAAYADNDFDYSIGDVWYG
ncbi:MAG: hypothetical protein R2687_10535 [Candidatus Nanopelagicales bacterium]